MEMTLRWYGSQYDTVTLKQIRQIPGVTGVISMLYEKLPGEVWEYEEILRLKQEIEAAGLRLSGIESVNVHDAIKVGGPDRDLYIDRYIDSLSNLGRADIQVHEGKNNIDLLVNYALDLNESYVADCTIQMNVKSKEEGNFRLES